MEKGGKRNDDTDEVQLCSVCGAFPPAPAGDVRDDVRWGGDLELRVLWRRRADRLSGPGPPGARVRHAGARHQPDGADGRVDALSPARVAAHAGDGRGDAGVGDPPHRGGLARHHPRERSVRVGDTPGVPGHARRHAVPPRPLYRTNEPPRARRLSPYRVRPDSGASGARLWMGGGAARRLRRPAMNILNGTMARLPRSARRQFPWRSLLAAPFVVSLVLTLVLGPATITSVHGSFTWLALLSLVAALLMLGVAEGLLIPVGLITFVVFPVLAGLGFNFAPNWARPVVVIIFYGSILASAAAALTGVVGILRSLLRTYPHG